MGGSIHIGLSTLGPRLEDAYKDFAQQLALPPVGFVGRRSLFADIEQFTSNNACGYYRLTADAGLGKTAIAAEMARRFSAEAFFVDANRNLITARQCLDHLCAGLIKRFPGYYHDLPAESEDSSFLSRMLGVAADDSEPPFWLVVDGLDEAAEATSASNTLLLPTRLPAGVFIFVTQRPGDYSLRTDPGTPIRDHVLAADSAIERADVREFLERQVDTPVMEARRTTEPATAVTREVLVARLLEASQGNFMFVSFLIADIVDGSRPIDTGSLGELPHGLEGYYLEMWRRMQEVGAREGSDDWARLLRPAAGLLAVAGEPVSAEWLSSMLDVPVAEVRSVVLRAWRRFVICTGEPGNEEWRFVHSSFQNFLDARADLDLPSLHGHIADWFANPGRWDAFGGYASRQLIRHLGLAGRIVDALALVRSHGWIAHQFEADPSSGRFRIDVATAWSAAAASDNQLARVGHPVDWLSDEVWMALYASTFTAFLQNIGPVRLRAMVEVGVLNDAQVLAMLDLDPRPMGRGRALVWLADVLEPESVDEAVRIARTLDGDARGEAILELAGRLPPERAKELLEEEVRVVLADSAEDHTAPYELAGLVDALPEVDLTSELTNAVHLAIIDPRSDSRAERLASLSASLPSYPALLETVLAAFDERDKSEQLEHYVKALEFVPSTHRGARVAEALELARERQEPDERAGILVTLVSLVVPEVRRRVVADVLAASLELESARDQADLLADLLEADLDPADKDWVVDAAQDRALAIPDPVARAATFGRLISVAPDDRLVELVEHGTAAADDAETTEAVTALVLVAEALPDGPRRMQLLHRAAGLAGQIAEDVPRANALMDVASNMEAEDARPLVLEVVRTPGGLLAIGKTQPDWIDRLQLLAALMPALDAARRMGLVGFALDSLVDPHARAYDRGQCLAALLPFMPDDRRFDALEDLRVIIDELSEPAERAELEIAILTQFPDPAALDLFVEAVEAARSIEPGRLYSTVWVDNESLVVHSDSMSPLMGCKTEALVALAAMDRDPQRRQSLLDEAFDAVYDLPARMQGAAIMELAPLLTAEQADRLLLDYRAILDDPARRAVVEGLSSMQIPDEDGEPSDIDAVPDASPNGPADSESEYDTDAGADTSGGQDVSFSIARSGDWSDLFGFSRAPGQAPLTIQPHEIALRSDDEIQDLGLRVLSGWAQDLVLDGHAELMKLPAWAREFGAGIDWTRAMAALLARMADETSVHMAIEEANATWPEALPPLVVCALAPLLDVNERETLVAQALGTATSIDDPAERAASFLALSRFVGRSQRATVESAIVEALDSSRAGASDAGPGRAVAVALTPRSALISPTIPLRLVQDALNDNVWDRPQLLRALVSLIPTLAEIGGPGVLDRIASAVTDISQRWPQRPDPDRAP